MNKSEEVNTEYWLEEKDGGILLKAKRNDQEQDFTIASIYEDGLYLYEEQPGIARLGFKVTTNNKGLSRIFVDF
ncbi:MAG: hypothetical protein NUV47_01135 [Patescibacteria group bacterium]|nr:hypothetical protein [Patescibacteria group bacterium]